MTPSRSAGVPSAPNAWDPAHYLKYADQRVRPALDLLARIPLEDARRVTDLGCGPGYTSFELARIVVLSILAVLLIGWALFEAHQAVAVGIAGLVGSGRSETLRAIFGADPSDGGSVRLADLGRVVDTFRETTGFVNISGRPGVAIGVSRRLRPARC